MPSATLGRIVQTEHEPLIITPNIKRLTAYVAESLKERVGESSFLVAEGEDGGPVLLCRVKRIESFPKASSIIFRAQSEFVTRLELEPIGQITSLGISPMPNHDFHNYKLRWASPDELRVCYGVPTEGLLCGDLMADQDTPVIPYRVPSELLYRSLFICGAKGSGKTTCLRSLLPNFVCKDSGNISNPSIVILDVEGEFSQQSIVKRFVDAGAETNLRIISTDPGMATSTLSLPQVHYEHFAYFAPDLPLPSLTALESIYKQLLFSYRERGIVRRAEDVLKDIREAAWRQPGIHTSQREAIVRVTMSGLFSMFDQENLPPLLPEDLVKPGRVSIIDVSSLTDDQQRVVALYLLSTFATYKTRSQDSTGLLLVMDEAQKLFPHRGDLKKDYAHRLARFVSGIVHRGRRRRYGVVLATQYPSDVSKEVVELCDTKIVFKMSGPIDWLKMTLGGSGFARSASELSVGEAYVVSTGLNIQQPARVRFPAVETSE